MRHPAIDWLCHSGRNPRMPLTLIGKRTRRDHERSRWIPHQSEREKARRRRPATEVTTPGDAR